MNQPPPPASRFLIIDDLASVRKQARDLLRKLNYQEVYDAETVPAGLALAEAMHAAGTPIDFILADWELPNYTGIDLLREVRSKEKFAALPLVIMTSVRSTHNISSALEAGVSGFLVKPFNEALLLDQISRAWEKVTCE